jgi:biopolymer transport protein ExbD
MVIVPVTPKGLEALVPQPPKDPAKQTLPNDRTIVVQILHNAGGNPSYKINETPVEHTALLSQLTTIYQNRAERVMFVKGDDDLNFAAVADVIDIAKSANVDSIGIITPKIQEGK